VARDDAATAKLKPAYSPFVDGRYVAGGDPLTVHSPATGERLAEVAAAGPADVERAVAAARRAQVDWGTLPARRARLLFRLAQVVADRARSWPRWRPWTPGARPTSPRRPVHRRRAPALVRRLGGQAGVRRLRGRPAPVGVLGVLVAGALPAVVRRVAPALACGNAVVLVPDPDAPLGALVLAEAAAEAGLPDGVLNVVPGGVLDVDVDAVAVTGPPAFCRDGGAARARAARSPARRPEGSRRSSTTTPRWTRRSTGSSRRSATTSGCWWPSRSRTSSASCCGSG
jgi:aldehyde dehydrogenase (NAD+)